MKRLFILTIILCSLFASQRLFAQETARQRIEKRQALVQQQKTDVPQLSVRAENMNDAQIQDLQNVPWMREIYRYIDLKKDENASLYYPVTPIGKRMNLFTMMFRLLAKGEIAAYEYPVDNIEVFNDSTKLKFKDLLDRFNIMYKEKNGQYVVDDSDVPSNQVQGYYLKEAWYFDQSNSTFDVKILALCPVLLQQDDEGAGMKRFPMFWVPYQNIRPYAAQMPIMTSNLNNASTQTIDDYFRKHEFDGEIYKTTNMQNRTLAQYCPTDSLMKKEQRKIEAELTLFDKKLWVYNDSIKTQEGATMKNTSKVKKEKIKERKSTASAAPERSMRTRR